MLRERGRVMRAFKSGMRDGGLLSSCGSSDIDGLLVSVTPETGVGLSRKFPSSAAKMQDPFTLRMPAGR